jgi:hypothetical protein
VTFIGPVQGRAVKLVANVRVCYVLDLPCPLRHTLGKGGGVGGYQFHCQIIFINLEMQYPVAITRIPEPFQGQYFAHSTDSAVQKIMKSVNGRTRIMPMGR